MKRHLFAGSALCAMALSISACSEPASDEGPPGDDSIFTTPEREEGDILCELTGTFEARYDCERFERQYDGLEAGVDAFNPSETMIADEPTTVRYAITRLPDSVQGGDGEIADAVPEPNSTATTTPTPTPTPTDGPTSGPSPTPTATTTGIPTGQPTLAVGPGISPTPAPISTALPVPGASLTPVQPSGQPIGQPVVGTPQPLSTERPDGEVITQSLETGAPEESSDPPPPPPPPPPPAAQGPTQAEIDAAMAEAGGRVSQIIGPDADTANVEVGTIKVGRLMYACLEADPSFRVEPQECQTRNTIEDPDADWRWSVTPTEPGEGYELKLRSGIVVRALDGTLRRIGQPSRSAEIDVRVTALGWVQRTLRMAEQWIRSPIGVLGAIAALLLALAGVRRAWKKMRGKNAEPDEVDLDESGEGGDAGGDANADNDGG